MSRRFVALLAATLVVVSMGVPLALAAPATPANTAGAFDESAALQTAANNSTTTTTTNTSTNASTNDTETPPGQKLAGVIGVQGSETNGEIERRSFERRFENANSNGSKAAVVAGQLQSARVRLETLEQRRERLETLHEEGDISEARYRVQMTRVVAELEQTKAILNRTESAATTVPESDLRERGVNTTELDELRTRANNLTGPEVSAIARDLAGDNPGKGLGRDKSDESDDEENETTESGDGSEEARGNGNGSDNASDGRPNDRGSDKGNDQSDRGQQAKDADNTTVTTDSDDSTESETTTDSTTTATDSSPDDTERGTADE